MFYPDNKILPVAKTDDYATVEPKAPISATFKVSSGMNNVLGSHVQGKPAEPEMDAVEPEPYSGVERRRMCRRLNQQECMLDTRSGRDRRRQTPEGQPTQINSKI